MAARKKASPRELAILKAAKARGLIDIDLRKKLSAYARKRAKLFESVYMQQASVIKVTREVAGDIRRGGQLLVKGDLVVVPKMELNEKIRFDKKSKRIVGKLSTGVRREIEVRYLPKDLPKNKRYRVAFNARRGKTTYKYFSTFDKLASIMRAYTRYVGWQDYVEIIDETEIPGRAKKKPLQGEYEAKRA